MVDVTNFRNAMSLLSSAVNVVTTDGVAGQHGFTASAVCSVTDTPPTLLVCMNTASRSYPHFVQNNVLAVNVLAEHHEELSNTFASTLLSDERFAKANWTTLVTGSPILENALVSFDCEIDQIQTVGTHGIFMCKIVAIYQHEDDNQTNHHGLVYFNRTYHRVSKHKADDKT